MPTIVDSLVLTLGIDASQYKQGQAEAQASITKTKQVASQAARDMEAEGGRAAEFFSRIKTEALSLVGVLAGTAGLGAVLRNATNQMADLQRAAVNLNMRPEGLAAIQNVMERNGASAQSVTRTFENLQKVMQDIKTFGGGSQFYGFLGPIGGSANDSPLQIMMKAMKFIQDHPGQTAQQNQILQGLGFNDDTIRAMRQIGTLPEMMKELQTESQRVPTEAMTEQAIKLQKAWEDLAHQTKFLGDTMTSNLAGPLSHVLDLMTELEKQHPDLTIDITLGAGALATLAALRAFFAKIGMKGAASAIDGLFAGAGSLVAPLALSGDTAPTTGAYATPPGGATFGEHGPIAKWWSETMPTWLGGAGNPGPPLPADIEAEVRRQASLRGLNPDHMVALVQKEGGGYHNVSPAGAFGPMQLMPGTAREEGVDPNGPWQDNVRGGMDYYWKLLQHFRGNYAAADAAYNAGPNNAGVKWLDRTGDTSHLPAETQDYIRSINGAHGRAASQLPPPAPYAPNGYPGATAADNSTSIQTGDLHITLPGVSDAQGFASQLPNALTAQANRGMIP